MKFWLTAFVIGVLCAGAGAGSARGASSSKNAPEKTASRDQASGDAGSTAAARPVMHQILGEILALRPYMASPEKFSDPKNQVEIEEHLKKLAKITKGADHNMALSKPSFAPSWKVLQDHITEMDRVFRSGNKDYARWMLSSTLSVCMSCHSQMPSASRHLVSEEEIERYKDSFDQAEFLFALRDFDRAHSVYKSLIENYPKNKLPADELDVAMERELAYYARIKRDPKVGEAALKTYDENKNLPEYVKKNLKGWLAAFKKWTKEPKIDPKTATPEQIKTFAARSLKESSDMGPDNPRVATYLRVSGVLYEYLNAHPDTPIAAQVLYWLAVCDRGTTNNFFYSLADIYLKTCMTKYPDDPAAKSCYKEYEEVTTAEYSGSGGTNLPDNVREEMDNFKKRIFK